MKTTREFKKVVAMATLIGILVALLSTVAETQVVPPCNGVPLPSGPVDCWENGVCKVKSCSASHVGPEEFACCREDDTGCIQMT